MWRAAAHQDACTGVGIVDGGWVVSCARDGSVAASHIGGGRQRLLRAAGGGPAQRCLQAGAALAYGLLSYLPTCLLAYLLACFQPRGSCVLTHLLRSAGRRRRRAHGGRWRRRVHLGRAFHAARRRAAGESASWSVRQPSAVGQHTLHPFTAPAQGGRVPSASLLGLGARQFFSAPLGRWQVAFPCTRCTCTARRARRAACCSASPTARWRCGGLRAGGSALAHLGPSYVPRPPARPHTLTQNPAQDV